MTDALKNVIDTLPRKSDEFSFQIPETHPSALDENGNRVKVTKEFTFPYVETEEQALAVITAKELKLVDIVNDILKSNSRSSAYQAATLVYKPSEVPKEDIVERMVRDFIRLGLTEEVARTQVSALLASQGK